MATAYANYYHFYVHDVVIIYLEIMPSLDAMWLAAIILPHEYMLMTLQDAARTIHIILLQHLFQLILHVWTALGT